MKIFYLLVVTLLVHSVNSQTAEKIYQAFSKEVDGIKISIKAPTAYKIVDNKFEINSVFMISKFKTNYVSRNVFKVSQKSIPQNFTNQMISEMLSDKNKSIQIFKGMERSDPLIKLDVNSFNSEVINGLNFYKIEFKKGILENICFSTVYKRKLFIIYITYITLKEGEMDEFYEILNSLVIK